VYDDVKEPGAIYIIDVAAFNCTNDPKLVSLLTHHGVHEAVEVGGAEKHGARNKGEENGEVRQGLHREHTPYTEHLRGSGFRV